MAYSQKPNHASYFSSICEAIEHEAQAVQMRIAGEYMCAPRTILIDRFDNESFSETFDHVFREACVLGFIDPVEDPEHADSPELIEGRWYDRMDLEAIEY